MENFENSFSAVVYTKQSISNIHISILLVPSLSSEIINSTVFFTLTNSSQSYVRPFGPLSPCYYQAFQIEPNVSGIYAFESISGLDTFVYIHQNNFEPLNPGNYISTYDDDDGGDLQFRASTYLNAFSKRILVATTYLPGVTGDITVNVFGPGSVQLRSIEGNLILISEIHILK